MHQWWSTVPCLTDWAVEKIPLWTTCCHCPAATFSDRSPFLVFSLLGGPLPLFYHSLVTPYCFTFSISFLRNKFKNYLHFGDVGGYTFYKTWRSLCFNSRCVRKRINSLEYSGSVQVLLSWLQTPSNTNHFGGLSVLHWEGFTRCLLNFVLGTEDIPASEFFKIYKIKIKNLLSTSPLLFF